MENQLEKIERRFRLAQIEIISSSVKEFPGESIYLIEVNPDDVESARVIADEIDETLEGAFLTIRKGEQRRINFESVNSITDPRVTELVAVLNENVRAGDDYRKFNYIEDASGKIAQAVSQRHHLIFGRRGVGKTALLLEAKKRLRSKLIPVYWKNMKPFSRLSEIDAFLTLVLDILEHANEELSAIKRDSVARNSILEAIENVRTTLNLKSDKRDKSAQLVPQITTALSRFTALIGQPFFLMLDDAHTLSRGVLPGFLDRIMACCSDNNVWLKVAGIHHQIRYFNESDKIGLEVPHDAQIIDLDVTLEDPRRASEFLTKVLDDNLKRVGISARSSVFLTSSIDRLVLASGGVPRDFLVLSGRSIQTARERDNARTVGVQDVNTAAGRYFDAKIRELDDDAAAEIGEADRIRHALDVVKSKILEQKAYTYFKVDLREKEQNPDEYRLIQSLGDFRAIHLLRASISDEHRAGVRHEVYLIDIALYSGQRLRKSVNTLEFKKGKLVARKTGTQDQGRVGSNSNAELSILRRAPVIDVSDLNA